MKVLLSCGKSHLRFVDFVFECYVSVLEAKFDRKKLIASLVSFVGCGVELKSVVDCFQSKCWINIWVERVFVSQCVIVVDFMYTFFYRQLDFSSEPGVAKNEPKNCLTVA